MTGFKTDYVNLISNNLRDRYKTGFPILKELVQNADDAGASSLLFGYHAGLRESADHELLRGPALWVLNNGRFRATDKSAIASFGVNSKAAETGAIGKFGLGMKSVYHLCEAFFYVASDGDADYHDVLNPWIQDENAHDMHQRWETCSARDLQALRDVAAVGSLARAGQSWFMLWVPLRRRSHVAQIDGVPTAPIIDRYPGEDGESDLDFFDEAGMDQRIGALLPLLRCLKTVEFAGTQKRPGFALRIEAGNPPQRLDHLTDGLSIAGKVDDGGPKADHLHFMARQTARIGQKPFSRLKDLPGWPKTNTIIAAGKRGPVRDKGEPEGAVAFSHADGRVGRLSLQWAVFLPTDEQRFSYDARMPGSSREYRIALHGQFFVDAGRRGIDGMDELADAVVEPGETSKESAVQLAWNQALAQQVVLPGLLPALDAYVRAEKFNDAEIGLLTDALRRCATSQEAGTGARFMQLFGAHVCSEHLWVRVLRSEGPAWELRPVAGRLLPLPKPANQDHARPWRALPGLAAFEETIFIDETAPRLCHAELQWEPEDACRVIDSIQASTLEGASELRYLLDFLRMHQFVALQMSDVQARLVAALRKALRDLPLAALRANRAPFRELIELLPAARRFGLGTREQDAKRALPEFVYRALFEVETEALLIPAEMAPSNDNGRPASADIVSWLRGIAGLVEKGMDMAACLDAADGLIKAIGAEKAQHDLLRHWPSLRVLSAVNAGSGEKLACSLAALSDSHQSSQLFRAADIDMIGLCQKLGHAVPGLRPLVVDKSLGMLVESAQLGQKRDVPRAIDATAIFRAIGMQTAAPALGTPEQRAALLSSAADADLTTPPVCDGIRYLLHGRTEHFKSAEPLWKDSSNHDSPWVRLLRTTAADSWNVLPYLLTRHLNPQSCGQLNIQSMERQSVIESLAKGGRFDKVDAAQFTPAELDILLGEIEHEDVWRRLPLHRDSDGTFGPIRTDCFLGVRPMLPPEFRHGLRIIVPSDSGAHARRQSALITKWSATEAARALLASDDASRHWTHLMNLLPDLQASDLGASWRDTPWLPLASGGKIALSHLVQLDELRADISDMAQRCDYYFAGLQDLADAVRSHSQFVALKEHVSCGEDALTAFAEMMECADRRIGRAAAQLDVSRLEQLRGVLSSLASLPGWALVYKAASAVSLGAVTSVVLGKIMQPLSVDQAEQVLAELSSKNASPSVESAFLLYLKEWVDSAPADALKRRLPHLNLLSADRQWRRASELAAGAFGIAEADSLHPQALPILAGVILRNDLEPADQTEAASGRTEHEDQADAADLETALAKWCDPLAQTSVEQAVGAVIGLFGSRARALTERWLGQLPYAEYLLDLNWKDPGYENGVDRRKKWMGGYASPEQPFQLLQPSLIECKDSEVRVKSLTGEERVLPLAAVDSMSSLLAGSLYWLNGAGVEIRMRPADCLLRFDLSQQKEILQRTAEELFLHLYNQPHANLTALWSRFEESDQVDLDVARDAILDSLPSLLQQWPQVCKYKPVQSALDALRSAKNEHHSARRRRSGFLNSDEKVMQAQGWLAELVNTDLSVQDRILAAIRKKVQTYHYEHSSVPFELLQNADDAVLEFQSMQQEEKRPLFSEADIGRFVMARGGASVMFMHWGRPINTSGKREGYRQDHARDLERMLMLGASGKEDEEGTTGKFGLGFKSVLLATDRPVVSSGDLRFEIIAGCLPQRAELSAPVRELARLQKKDGLRATVVELPVSEESADALLPRFVSLAGMCAVFTRQVRHIEVDGTTHSWRPRRLIDVMSGAWCELGRVQLPLPRGKGVAPSNLLVLRCAQGAVALRIEDKAVPFAHDAEHAAPAVWVNAPTRGMPATGLILNARFDIDTGRGSLPHGAAAARNQRTAAALAEALTPVVVELLNRTSGDWAAWADTLSASSQLSVAEYWHALWTQVIGNKPAAEASQDAMLAEAFASTLFDSVTDATGIVPNGLRGEASAFVHIDAIKVAFAYERFQPLLPILARWAAFTAKFPRGSWCAREVQDWLERRPETEDASVIEDFARSSVLHAFGPNRRVNPEDVPVLAEIMQAWPQTNLPEMPWTEVFLELQFRARSGTWKRAGALFTNLQAGDALLRLAPAESLLDPDYETHAHVWKVIRDNLYPRPDYDSEVANWCVQAASRESRAAAIEWLSQHLNREMVWAAIRRSPLFQDWIGGLHAGHELLAHLRESERTYMLSLLGLIPEDKADAAEAYDNPAAELTFDMIHDWWEANRDTLLRDYERGLWPQRIDKQRLATEPVDREAWMTLFSLAVFRRVGRANDAQHRGFLDFLERKGWWYTISQLDPQEAVEAWIDILRDYAESSQVSAEFEQWMDGFPRLYRMARWFDNYVELFQSAQLRDTQTLRHLLTPASDASLSGSDLEAPTLRRTLHLGHNLVIRELLRTGVLNSEATHQMAFMPVRGVHELVSGMGYEAVETSEDIYALLLEELGDAHRASFAGDFDIPLLLLANNPDRQREVIQWNNEDRDDSGACEAEEEIL